MNGWMSYNVAAENSDDFGEGTVPLFMHVGLWQEAAAGVHDVVLHHEEAGEWVEEKEE